MTLFLDVTFPPKKSFIKMDTNEYNRLFNYLLSVSQNNSQSRYPKEWNTIEFKNQKRALRHKASKFKIIGDELFKICKKKVSSFYIF